MTSSTMPPEYAAEMPRIAASAVAIAPAAAPSSNERRAPTDDLREDVASLVGRAEQVVPATVLARVEEVRTRSPCSTESSGAISAEHDQAEHDRRARGATSGCRASAASQPGTRASAAPRRPASRPAARSIGVICDISYAS